MKIITVGLGYGDEGKGTIVDALVRHTGAQTVVRYCGGAQASHSVYNEKGVRHSFSQFSAGTFVPGVMTFLSKYMIVNPLTLLMEAEELESKGVRQALKLMYIDKRALITTPYYRALNRLRELARGDARHGSCGMGIGEAVYDALTYPDDALRVGDIGTERFGLKLLESKRRMLTIANRLKLPDSAEVTRQLSTFNVDFKEVLKRYEPFYYGMENRLLDEEQSASMLRYGTVVFEGAQGVLLDEWCGFHPYTTWSTVTPRNARLLLDEAEVREKPLVIGITRSYSTRHGAGPFVTEDPEWTKKLVDQNNPHNPWQHTLRCGPLDLVALSYAKDVCFGVDMLAMTHMDAVTYPWPVCTAYDSPVLARACAYHKLGAPSANDERGRLEFMGAITKELGSVKHKLDQVTKDNLHRVVYEALDTPVYISSHGPGPCDKTFRGLFEPKSV